jgi:hypothetical protein
LACLYAVSVHQRSIQAILLANNCGMADQYSSDFDSWLIRVYNSEEKTNLILRRPCDKSGRKWVSLLAMLQAICKPFSAEEYFVKRFPTKEIVPLSGDMLIKPGSYCLVPMNGADTLEWGYNPQPIIPSAKSSVPSSPTTYASGSKKRQRNEDENNVLMDAESITTIALGKVERTARFRERLLQRDNHCCISRVSRGLEASHIVANSWWDSSRRHFLPEDVVDAIYSLEYSIDSVRNGLLLQRNVASDFDAGDFSLRYDRGHYFVVSLSPRYSHLEGTQMDENLRPMADGTLWWSSKSKPHPILVQFHLRNSVFKHMKGSGEEPSGEDENDFLAQAKQMVLDRLGDSEYAVKISENLSFEDLQTIYPRNCDHSLFYDR